MTIPVERTRAVMSTRQFLLNLCDTSFTKRIPRAIREQARSLLKHYPSRFDMDTAAESVPTIWGKRE